MEEVTASKSTQSCREERIWSRSIISPYFPLFGFCFRFSCVVFMTLWTVLVVVSHIDSTLLHYTCSHFFAMLYTDSKFLFMLGTVTAGSSGVTLWFLGICTRP